MNKKILIAEDQPDSRQLLTDLMDIFKPFGVQVHVAVDGTQAFDIATREKPDLLLLDIMMPGMSGLEVCEKIKKNPETAQGYVIMVSAKNTAEDLQHAVQRGADEYITKPYEVTHLLERVQSTLKVKLF